MNILWKSVFCGFFFSCAGVRCPAATPAVALVFSGADDVVRIDDADGRYRLTEYTYSFWIKILEGPTGDWRQVFSKGSGLLHPADRGPSVWLRPDEMRFYFRHAVDHGDRGVESREIPIGQWMQAAFVATGADGEMQIFLDGRKDVALSVSGLVDAVRDPRLWIGSSPSHSGVHARVSDFRVYDRALPEDAIRALYEGRHIADGLVGWWPMDEGRGNQLTERIIGNDGLFAGLAAWYPPPLSTDLSEVLAAKGEEVALGPVTLRAPEGPVRYLWYFNGEPIDGATNNRLILPSLSAAEMGVYQVRVTDDLGSVVSAPAHVLEPVPEFILNVGADDDDELIIHGIYTDTSYRPYPDDLFFAESSYRWFGEEWALRVPVFPGINNEVVLYAYPDRLVRLDVPGLLDGMILTPRPVGRMNYGVELPLSYEQRILLPADLVGEAEYIEIHGHTVVRHRPADAGEDPGIAIACIRVRPVDQVPDNIMVLQQLPLNPEPDVPVERRLRGVERRPMRVEPIVLSDVESYVTMARWMRINAATIGPMEGHHYTAFDTQDGVPFPDRQPGYIPELIRALNQWGIVAIGWLPFNLQDVRDPDRFPIAQKYPQWKMEYIDWDERPGEGKIGMCVGSSPWRKTHAGILQEAVALGFDTVFFDGVYLGGIPHPASPGCVCSWCRTKFLEDTGLEIPGKVDWTDPVFRRWVHWRYHQLVDTIKFFRDEMREVNPDLKVRANYNNWPFGGADWSRAVPLWSTDEYAVSQHTSSRRPEMKWVMLGYKARLSHDLNPAQSDIWRHSRPFFSYDRDTPENRLRREINLRSFMLGGLTYGTVPWHGGYVLPSEIGVRINEMMRERESFFSHETIRHIGVLLSQNTHDFYGHLTGSDGVVDYQDTILGAWLMLTEHHMPFRFVFDNDLEAGNLDGYQILFAPNTACLSDRMAEHLGRFVKSGGLLITTAETGGYDEWGERRDVNALANFEDKVIHLPGTPVLNWLRERDESAMERVIQSLAGLGNPPFVVEAPRWLVVNAFRAPGANEVWMHLLNVSAYYPNGDTGFRGMRRDPVYPGSWPEIHQADGKVKRQHVPVRHVALDVSGLNPVRVYLGVGGDDLERDETGRFIIPEVDVHEVLVIELE